MHVADKGMRKFAIGHMHGQPSGWAPKQMGVIAAIEKAKVTSAMASPRAIATKAIATAWPQPSSPDVYVYRLPTNYLTEDAVEPDLAVRFETLVDEWETDTAFTSGLNEMVMHQNYQEIIGMGLPALPFIFERITDSPARWFWALRAIVGHDVAANATTSSEAAERWLDWGNANGYVR